MWTKVKGTVRIDTGVTLSKEDLKMEVEDTLRSAPVIHGTEENASYYVIIPNGYNMWDDEGQWQTDVIIVIDGDLRDVAAGVAAKELDAFLRWLSENFFEIIDRTILVEDTSGQSVKYGL